MPREHDHPKIIRSKKLLKIWFAVPVKLENAIVWKNEWNLKIVMNENLFQLECVCEDTPNPRITAPG